MAYKTKIGHPRVDFRVSKFFPLLLAFLVLAAAPNSFAHPLPELPVWASFKSDGTARFEVEVDPRCFAEDPNKELYMLHWYLQRCDDGEKEEMFEKAKAFLPTRIKQVFGPGEWAPEPLYECRFTKLGGEPLNELSDPVVIRVTWRVTLPPEVHTYQLKAHKVGIFSVLFLNYIDDVAVPRTQTLFPGEESYVLDLKKPVSKETRD